MTWLAQPGSYNTLVHCGWHEMYMRCWFKHGSYRAWQTQHVVMPQSRTSSARLGLTRLGITRLGLTRLGVTRVRGGRLRGGVRTVDVLNLLDSCRDMYSHPSQHEVVGGAACCDHHGQAACHRFQYCHHPQPLNVSNTATTHSYPLLLILPPPTATHCF